MDIGWAELMVVGIVALIVVGPKDLPGMFRTLGKYTGKVRRMAREFQRAMEDAADEAGVKETAKDLKKMTSPKKLGLDALDEAADRFDKWDPTKTTEKAPTPEEATARLAEERAKTVQKANENAAAMAEQWTAPDEADVSEAPAESAASESHEEDKTVADKS